MWDKGRERKLRTKTDFFFSPPFFLSLPKILEQWKREILLFFTVSGVVVWGFFIDKNLLNFLRHSVLLPNARHGGAASDRPTKWTDLRGFRFSKYCLQDGEPVVNAVLQSRQTTLRSEERWCCRVTE